MGDVVLVQIQLPAQRVQAEILAQVFGNIVRDRLEAGDGFFFLRCKAALPDCAAQCQKQVPDAQADLRVPSEAVGVQFLQQPEEFAAEAVELQGIHRVHILSRFPDRIEQIQIIRGFAADDFTELLTEPENKAAVRHIPAAHDGAVLRAGRQDQHVPGVKGLCAAFDFHLNLALTEEVDFGVGMAVPPDR